MTSAYLCLQVTKLCDLGPAQGGDGTNETVCSVSWSQRGTYLALGVSGGGTQIWDVARDKWCAPGSCQAHALPLPQAWMTRLPRKPPVCLQSLVRDALRVCAYDLCG